jgi:F-type H+-transporting ATPase subunit b
VLDFSVTFFITIANIALFVFVMKRLLWKPMKKFMDARTRKVKEELDAAATARSVAEELKARYEGLLAEAEKEAEAMVKEGVERGKEEGKAILAKAEADAVEIRHRAEERAAFELRRAHDELAGEVAALALAAASRIAGRNLGGADDLAEAESFVRGIGAGRG